LIVFAIFFLSTAAAEEVKSERRNRNNGDTPETADAPTELEVLIAYLGQPSHPVVHTPTGSTIVVKPDGTTMAAAMEYCGDDNEECVQQLSSMLQEITLELNTTLLGLASEGRIGTIEIPIKHSNGSESTLIKPVFKDPSSIDFKASSIHEACNEGQMDFTSCDHFVHFSRKKGLISEIGAVRVGLDFIKEESTADTVEILKEWTEMTENATVNLLDDLRRDKELLREAFNNMTISKREEIDILKRRVVELEAAAGLREDKGRKINVVPVKRFQPGELSYSDYLDYAKRSEPFVVNYGGDKLIDKTGVPGVPKWTLESIRTTCFNRTFPLKVEDTTPNSHNWARLKSIGSSKIEHYVDAIIGEGSGMDENSRELLSQAYLHDASLHTLCPELLEEVVIPKYFSLDLTQHLPQGFNFHYPAHYWPSLFIGPGGKSSSALHADILDTAAWMGVVQGKKHWRLVPPSERFLLHERPEKRNVFEANLFDFSEDYGSVRFATIYDTILSKGDVIFIPSASAHQVNNLPGEPTIAIAMNYVDETNEEMFLSACNEVREENGDSFKRYIEEVIEGFKEARRIMGGVWREGVDASIKDLLYGEFKKGMILGM